MDFTKMLGDELKNKAMGVILEKVGGDKWSANSIISQALPAILWGLEKNTATDEGVNALSEALEKHTGETKIDITDGKKILGHILWNNSDSQVASIATSAGISEEQSWDVMGILSSLVMEKLGDQKAAGLDGNAIAKMLSGTSLDTGNMLGMFLDQDADGDFDKNDAMKFGMSWVKNKFLGKK